ncbi:50S ribosomal protein L35 [bacterium]|jgi:ribosomal protein L35|nr:50S ribosomal protein L35 [bacterium]
MGKLKTKKTLLKRVKISGSGKIIRKQQATSHNKRKWSASKRFSKLKNLEVTTSGIVTKLKKLLPGK